MGNSGMPDPIEIGLPPVSRKGLVHCDEFSPNYEQPCTVDGEDGASLRKAAADMP